MDPPSVIVWLSRLGQDSRNVRLIVLAVGILGDPAGVPWLIEKMRVPVLARVAGQSFSMITGADLAGHQLEGPPPLERSPADPTDDAADENVTVDPDANLAWPNPGAVQAWWQSAGGRYPEGTRFLRGIPLGQHGCNVVLREGYPHERRAAAYELVLMNPGRPLWNWQAKSRAQLVRLMSPNSGLQEAI